MEKIAVVGYKGRLGSLIFWGLQKDYDVCGVGRDDRLEDFNVSLVIDFASHESSVNSAEYCLKKNIPLIIGSTGQTEEENKRLDEISRHIKIVRKANFSKGAEVLKNFIESVSIMNPERFEIVEKHHKNKKDAPSGTAIDLANFIKERFARNVEINSIREGEEMGEHTIVAFCGDEKLTISHNVYSRNAFVFGVVQDVKNLLN